MSRPLLALLVLSALAGGIRAGDFSNAKACVVIADNAARLACYDAAYGVGAAPVAAAVRPAPEFGDRGQLHHDRNAASTLPKRVDFKVSKVENLAGGLYRLTMDNGQVWVTRESDWALDFKNGDEVTIQRMVAGSFRVSHKGQGRNVTVARIS